jgi:hypothetical protein
LVEKKCAEIPSLTWPNAWISPRRLAATAEPEHVLTVRQ